MQGNDIASGIRQTSVGSQQSQVRKHLLQILSNNQAVDVFSFLPRKFHCCVVSPVPPASCPTLFLDCTVRSHDLSLLLSLT